MKLRHHFRVFSAALVDVVVSRFDLASAELDDLLARTRFLLGLLLACAFAAALGALFLAMTIILAVPDAYRWIPALIFGLLFAGGSAAAGLRLRRSLRDQPPPFASTRDVLHRDAAAIRHLPHPATESSSAENRADSPASTSSPS